MNSDFDKIIGHAEFVKLVRKAIGPYKTQKQFAAEIGISAEHLTRMLKQSGRPTDATLEKIADHSEGRVSIAELKKSLGIKPSEEDLRADLYSVDYQTRNTIIIKDMKDGIMSLALNKPVRFQSLDDLMDILVMLFGWGDTTYDINGIDSYKSKNGNERNGSEGFANITVSWDNEECRCDFAFVLYYCFTTGGGVIATDIAFDLKTLLCTKHPIAEEVYYGLQTEDSGNYPLVYVTTVHTPDSTAGVARKTDIEAYRECLFDAAETECEAEMLKKLIARAKPR